MVPKVNYSPEFAKIFTLEEPRAPNVRPMERSVEMRLDEALLAGRHTSKALNATCISWTQAALAYVANSGVEAEAH